MDVLTFSIRKAVVADAPEIARNYNIGLDERIATFNTEHVTSEDRRKRIEESPRHPVYVAVSFFFIQPGILSLPYEFNKVYNCYHPL